MLPSILEIANQHNLTLIFPKGRSKEVLGKCPFCRADEGKRNKHYLSLNVKDNVFRCWYCGEKGGVCRFESLLTGIPESEITEKYRGTRRKNRHPAEKLTNTQLRFIGFYSKPNWKEMRKKNMDYYRRTLDWIWQEWRSFLQEEKRQAFVMLLVSLFSNHYDKGIAMIQKREQEIGESMLDDLLRLFSQSKWPQWAIDAKRFAMHICNPTVPFQLTEEEQEALLVEKICLELEKNCGIMVQPEEVENHMRQACIQRSQTVKSLSKPAGQYYMPVAQ
ncbi:hypothetical protein QO009_003038 [Brevibacillus aydinogluensis]|uniref:hypothetical protein n=1 Tax=Brevibacillus aydinogluensis TaxID=927786 RepID=UPI002892A6CF|nr:hypothetical protein [Brevibacillus aydinogluensis]MDT3417143.1 hypothetical protein [Brevibacillus aydinogluensis]